MVSCLLDIPNSFGCISFSLYYLTQSSTYLSTHHQGNCFKIIQPTLPQTSSLLFPLLNIWISSSVRQTKLSKSLEMIWSRPRYDIYSTFPRLKSVAKPIGDLEEMKGLTEMRPIINHCFHCSMPHGMFYGLHKSCINSWGWADSKGVGLNPSVWHYIVISLHHIFLFSRMWL